MHFMLVFLLLIGHFLSTFGSDLRVVPSWNFNNTDEVVAAHRPINYDRIVPQIYLAPLGIRQKDAPVEPKNLWNPPSIANSDEVKPNGNLNVMIYPTPRPRIDETDTKFNPRVDVPTPRARIDLSLDKVKDKDNENITSVQEDKKPVEVLYHAMPVKFGSQDGIKGQEHILIIQDSSSTEEDSKSSEVANEVSDSEIQKYIDALDAKIMMNKNRPQPSLKENVVNPNVGLRKNVVSDYEAPKVKPEISLPNISTISERRDGLSYNIGFGDAKASKPALSSILRQKRESSAVGKEKITNERKTSGGVSYNIGFGDAKSSKPALSSSPRRQRNVQISDHQNETKQESKLTSSDSLSEELTKPDQQLEQTNQKSFDEILQKSIKDHQNQNGLHTQEVQRLPHRGPVIKHPGFLAIDPPESSESESDENEPVVIGKTIVLEDSDENRTQNVFIEDSNIHFNVINIEKKKEEHNEKENIKTGFFWKDGITIGLHVSPLAMCLFTALILLMLLMRLALNIHKKRLENKIVMAQQPGTSGKNKHEFDDISLKTDSKA